jgi:hypothetical protein
MKIHSNFYFKTYSFRQNVDSSSLGIIYAGKAKILGAKRSH